MTWFLLIVTLCGGGFLLELREQSGLVRAELPFNSEPEARSAAFEMADFLVLDDPHATVWTDHLEGCR